MVSSRKRDDSSGRTIWRVFENGVEQGFVEDLLHFYVAHTNGGNDDYREIGQFDDLEDAVDAVEEYATP